MAPTDYINPGWRVEHTTINQITINPTTNTTTAVYTVPLPANHIELTFSWHEPGQYLDNPLLDTARILAVDLAALPDKQAVLVKEREKPSFSVPDYFEAPESEEEE